MQYVQPIELDVANCNLYKCIYAKQGDAKSRYIKATILVNGEKVTVSSDMRAMFRAVKPDGTSIYNSAVVNEDGTITAELTQQTLAVEGTVDADILIMSSDGEELSTAPFKIDVEMSPCGDKIDSDNEFLELIKMIRRGEEVIEKAEEAAGKIGDLAALKTDAKDNLVEAINEAAESGGSSDAVLYTPQVLTDEQKKQARKNIDAASDFVVNATLNLDRTAALDKTFGQMSEALAAGKNPIVHVRLGNENSYLKMSVYTTGFMVFTNIGMQDDGRFDLAFTLTVTNDKATYGVSYLLAADGGQHLPQISMAADPTEDMQIATKKYVDDKEFILQSTTPNSTKRFKITVDDGGTLSAVEVTE